MTKENKQVRAPDWLLLQEGITNRQWKSRKRKELKEVIRAFDNYRTGCAYCPGEDGEADQLGKLLEQMKEAHSVKEWGR